MVALPTTNKAYQLFHEGSLMLARMEANGIRVDMKRLDEQTELVSHKIETLQKELVEDPVFAKWKEHYRSKTNLGSRRQLAYVTEQILGYEITSRTKSGEAAASAEALQDVDHPFVKKYLRVEQYKKCRSTYLNGIRQETHAGYLHPIYNLHLVETYRGSCDHVNFQNIPIRDPEIGELIRKCFVPREGRVMVEIDYGALEFVVAANFWKDRLMLEYASDPKKDIHGDSAAKLFLCPRDQVSKPMRAFAKNQFVFPILYGSYYISCARDLWDTCHRMGLKLNNGTSVLDHLKSKGITKLGRCNAKFKPDHDSFERVVRDCEDNFNEMFPTFRDQKEIWWARYQQNGYFDLMTGFRVRGSYSRNFLMNCPIQGPGFHCLLWSLIEAQKEIDRSKMGTLLIGQIHDCALGDTPRSELQQFLDLVKDIMTNRLRKHWDWIRAPMKVEVDVVPENKTWHDKAPYVQDTDGAWILKG